jgi:hypothetical protein
MVLWLIALALLVGQGIVAYYQGAIRVTASLVGLLLGAMLAVPLGRVVEPMLAPFGLTHPVLVSFVAPAVVYAVILALFKTGALLLHKKVDTWMRYNASDTQRRLYERLAARVGICVGVANAFVYLQLIGMVAYTLGYFTTQVASPGQDGFWLGMLNRLNEDLRASGMIRAAAYLSPAKPSYYDACDLLGDIFHNPLLQGRLANYPPFLSLSERPEFKPLGEVQFQRFWQAAKTFGDVWHRQELQPLLKDENLYKELWAMLGGDLSDLTTYFRTGVSPKYEDDKILGRWQFDFRYSFTATRRSKPNASLNEIARFRKVLESLRGTSFVATVDQKAVLKVNLANQQVTVQGSWKNKGGGRFALRMQEPGKSSVEVEARVEGRRLYFSWLGYQLVLQRIET